MLTNRTIINILLKKSAPIRVTQVATCSSSPLHNERLRIGKREWVCYGINGQPHYADRVDIPFPAVRFQEIKGDLIALREKEKGDWKNLTMEEKKRLYRTSFRQTLVEKEAPTGEWKYILAYTLVGISVAFWIVIFEGHFIFCKLPDTFSDENRAIMLRKLLDLKYGFVSGVSSKWDYEKDDWKK